MMHTGRRQFTLQLAAAAAATLAPSLAPAQTRLQQARILCGFPPGDPIDTLARQCAERMRGSYADVVIVDNKPGAGGRIAIEAMKGAPADGSVLLFTPASMLVVYPHVYKSLSYDSLRDTTPVSRVTQVFFALTVGPMVPADVKSLPQFLEWCRANPGKASYASSGQGSSPHLTAALLSKESKVPMTMVPYRGGALAATDLIAGQIASAATTLPVMVPHHKAGKARILAVSSAQRLPQLPDVPTFAEQGFPQIVMSEWFGVFLPGGASQAVAQAANTAVRAAVQSREVIAALDALSLAPSTAPLAEFTLQVRSDYGTWSRVAKSLDLQLMD